MNTGKEAVPASPHLLTTDGGLEDVAAQEVREARPGVEAIAQPDGCRGLVRVEGAGLDELLSLSTVHHVIELRAEAEASSLDEIERAIAAAAFPELDTATSFRVSSERIGEHAFHRVDIQRVAGAVLHRRHGTRVDLEHFEVEVRVDLHGARLFAGLNRTPVSLGRRIRRAVTLRSALKPTVAAAMLRLAGAHHGPGRLLDPMCGSGTIPIEALRINPGLRVSASDWDAETVEAARATIANHALAIEVREADARSLAACYAERFDWIVTDPPYGVRQARHSGRTRLYGLLLASFEQVLAPDGKIVVIALKHAALVAAAARSGLRVEHERRVDLGRIEPWIVVLAR